MTELLYRIDNVREFGEHFFERVERFVYLQGATITDNNDWSLEKSYTRVNRTWRTSLYVNQNYFRECPKQVAAIRAPDNSTI